MRGRKIIGLSLIISGILAIIASVALFSAGSSSLVSPVVLVVLGLILLALGLILLITYVFETWLSRGQTALVDGLQAG